MRAGHYLYLLLLSSLQCIHRLPQATSQVALPVAAEHLAMLRARAPASLPIHLPPRSALLGSMTGRTWLLPFPVTTSHTYFPIKCRVHCCPVLQVDAHRAWQTEMSVHLETCFKRKTVRLILGNSKEKMYL